MEPKNPVAVPVPVPVSTQPTNQPVNHPTPEKQTEDNPMKDVGSSGAGQGQTGGQPLNDPKHGLRQTDQRTQSQSSDDKYEKQSRP